MKNLESVITKHANQIKLKKEDKDYIYCVNKYQFIATKQPEGGYYLECMMWDARFLFQSNVDLMVYETMSLKNVKAVIFMYLLSQSANKALQITLNKN